MVIKLARQTPALFKGFAVIGANLPVETNDDCIDTKIPVSLLLMNGTNDPINPYEGGDVILDGQNFGSVTGAEESLRHWLTVSNCDTLQKLTTLFPENNTAGNVTATQETYYSATDNKQISFVKVINGGHTIPNRNFLIPIKKMGKLNKDIDGPKLVWDFFAALQ